VVDLLEGVLVSKPNECFVLLINEISAAANAC
jgi:hypothetical protein